MKIKIKNRFTGEIILQGEEENLRVFLDRNKNTDLRNADLGNADLRGANLGNTDLGDANLGNADLRCANLGNANLGNANLKNANLENANLGNANLGNADLRCANLRNADLGDGFKYSCQDKEYIQKTIPIQIFLIHYIVIIFTETIQIGCKHYTIKEWSEFTDEQINEMDKVKSLEWWRKYKVIIMELAGKQ